MSKLIVSLSFLLVSSLSLAQQWVFEKPNYADIEKNIALQGSNLFYSNLMARFNLADTTMSLEEKRHLYYGYTFHSNYSPYGSSTYRDSVSAIYRKDSLVADDYQLMIAFCDSMLQANPFDFQALGSKVYAYDQQGDTTKAFENLKRMSFIVDAIVSSGDGVSKETAFYVIQTSHEYFLLDILGFQFGGSQSLIGHYDYLTVQPNEADIEGVYFDVSPCLGSLSKQVEK